MAGFSQGGGVGLTLAQWMIEGETERETALRLDVARFGTGRRRATPCPR
jgi:dimethylglycine dehydrogenase